MSAPVWYQAHTPDFPELIAGIRHRLANAAAPLAVLVELLDDDISDDMAQASKRSVAKVERLLGLLSALAGRGVSTPKATPLRVERRTEGMPGSWEPVVTALLGEVAPDAFAHGATQASITYDGEKLSWADNGNGFTSDVLESLGRRQRGGEHGCGLGLAVVCAIAAGRGLRTEAANDTGARLRFVI